MKHFLTKVWIWSMILMGSASVYASCGNVVTPSASPGAIPRDRVSISETAAVVKDCNGNPVVGTAVIFSISGSGQFSDGTTANKTETTDIYGRASVEVRSNSTSSTSSSTRVTMQVGTISVYVDVMLRGITVTVSSSVSKLVVPVSPAQTGTITATCKDTANTSCRGIVSLSTSLGSISPSPSLLNGSGQAIADLSGSPATLSPSPNNNATATVTATVGTVSGSVNVAFHRAQLDSSVTPHQAKIKETNQTGGEQVTATLTVKDSVDGTTVGGVSVNFNWYTPSGNSNETLATNSGSGSASSYLPPRPPTANGIGQFQGAMGSSYTNSHEIRFRPSSFYTISGQVSTDKNAIKATLEATFGAANVNLTYDASNNGRITLGIGKKF